MTRLSICSVLLLLAAACGGGGDDEEPTSTATSTRINGTSTATTATSAPNNNGGAQEVGAVENADGDAFVNDERADQNLELLAGDSIKTGEDSSIDFTLNGVPGVECKTRANSELVVRPDNQTQIQWTSRDGISFCTVERGTPPVQATFGIDPDVQIEVEGTLFGVTPDATLKVVEGFVIWRTPGVERRIGPNEQVSVSSDRQAWANEDLPGDEDAVLNEFPAPAPPPPPTDGEFRQSELLTDMQGQSAIIVLLDDSASSETEEFAWSYFTLLGETWIDSSDVDVQPGVGRQEAEVLLQQNSNAVYVAPASAAAAPPPARTATGTATYTATATPLSLSSAPFYVDGSGQAWSILFPQDQPAVSAFARFTRAILSTGAYFDMYSPLFNDNAPPYDELLAIVP